jgi:hypothetical protein
MWLSGANAVAGKACGAGVAEMRRQQTSVTKQAARFWSGTWLAGTKPQPKPKRRRRACIIRRFAVAGSGSAVRRLAL